MIGFWLGLTLFLFSVMAVLGFFFIKKSVHPWMSLGMLTFVFFFSLGTYLHFGSSDLYRTYLKNQQAEASVLKVLKRYPTTDALITEMERTVLAHPQQAQGWYLLGKLYFSVQRYQDAMEADKKALMVQNNVLSYQEAYVEASFFAEGKRLSTETRKMVETILKKDPSNPTAINFLALDAYDTGHYEKAIHYWETLLSRVSPDSADGKAILAAIRDAETKQAKGIPSS